MEAYLNRQSKSVDNAIVNEMKIQNDIYEFKIYVLENETKKIPKGSYNVRLEFSPKFDTNLYTIDVPGRKWIRMHIGNSVEDTTGCLVVGLAKVKNYNQVLYSRQALELLHKFTNGGLTKIHIL